MVSTEEDINALARVSIVDINGNIVFDELVKPPSKVTNFRRHVTGLTAQMLRRARPFA